MKLFFVVLIVFYLVFLISCFSFSNDSGIFAMKNLELWDPSVSMMEKYCEADIPHIHIKYVNEMIFNDFNSSDDGLSKVKEYDAEVILVPMPLFVFVPSCIVLITFSLRSMRSTSRVHDLRVVALFLDVVFRSLSYRV